MELWNDFEGKVVDDQYRLGRLLAPKGRSAFFAATGPRMEPVSIRLIESLNDENEILARWRRVRALDEEHLVRMQACGQAMIDGTHLVYAVLEPTDAELGEVLRERPLTQEEARSMAAAVLAGLEALHAAGLVHEHVEAGSVLAQGEVIKLRSDCVREAPEGAAGETLRRRDAHDFAMLVGYALTLRRDAMQGVVPRQFEDLVRNGVSGTWGLREMAALLRPAGATAGVAGASANVGASATAGPGTKKVPGGAAAPVPHVASVLPAAVNGGAVGNGSTGNGVGQRVPGSAAAGPMLVGPRGAGASAGATAGVGLSMAGAMVGVPERLGTSSSGTAGRPVPAAARPVVESGRAAAPSYAAAAVASALGSGEEADRLPTRRASPTERVAAERDSTAQGDGRRRLLVPLAVLGAILLLVLMIWYFVRGSAAKPAQTAQATPVAAPILAKPSAASAAGSSTAAGRRFARTQAGAPTKAISVPAVVNPPASAAAAGMVWRVVSYTYTRQEQAQGKVSEIAARHPELKAEVFTPSGRSPFLVTVGGWMNAGQAETERERARRNGLPRDTYAQNYHGR